MMQERNKLLPRESLELERAVSFSQHLVTETIRHKYKTEDPSYLRECMDTELVRLLKNAP